MYRPNSTQGSKHKLAKGHKQYMAQNRKAEAKRKALKAVKKESAREKVPAYLRKKWAQLQNWYYKTRYLRGKYTPHQGEQEKARRVQQMTEHKCINPEAWL